MYRSAPKRLALRLTFFAGLGTKLACAGTLRARSVSGICVAFELFGFLQFLHSHSLDMATVRLIYASVAREAMATGDSDDERMAEMRKRMLAVVRGA